MAFGSSPWNGDTLTKVTEYLDRHFEKLEHIVKAIEDQKEEEHWQRKMAAVALDATGAGQISFAVPMGFDWIAERVTLTSTANGQCLLYLDNVQPSNLVEVVGSSQLYSDAFANKLFIPGGSAIIFSFTGAGANGQATANLQVKLVKSAAHTERTRNAIGGF